MRISKAEVEHIALLSRLELSEEEARQYTEEMNSILDYAALLQKIDTREVVPTAHAIPLNNVFREDEVQPSMAQDKILENAPDAEDGFFIVPKIV